MPAWRPLKDRFSEKYIVHPTTCCWEWQGTRLGFGYGVIKDGNGKNAPAHRVSYEMHVAPIPEGMIVCHRCDNPSCVNPEHLFVGTYKDNMADLKRKGRARALTASQARELLQDLQAGMFQPEVAAKYGVSRSTVQNTVKLAKNHGFGGDQPAKNVKKYVRLTDRQIIEIVCLLHQEKVAINWIAGQYNIDRKTVRNIRDKMI
jgi:DNA-binding CsgD family transcriptional regulator